LEGKGAPHTKFTELSREENTRAATITALLLVPLLLAPAQAMILIDVGSVDLLPDETATVDVLISSDESAGELLSAFNLELRITPTGGTTSTLQLVDPQTNAYDLDPAYVFSGSSGGLLRMVLSSGSQPGDTLLVGDSTADFSDVTLTASQLLVRVEIDHQFPAGVDPASTLGQSFTFEVVERASTFFYDKSYVAPLSYTSTPGTATIVPEPGSLIVWSIFGAIGLIALRRRWRSSPAAEAWL